MVKLKTPITKLTITPEMILDKSMTLYGPTKSGKSTITKNLCTCIEKYISYAFLFCNTSSLTGDFDGLIPDWCISKNLSESRMTAIIDEQEKRREYTDNADKYAREFWPLISDGHIDKEYREECSRIENLKKKFGSDSTREQIDEIENMRFQAEFDRNKKTRSLIDRRRKELYRKCGFSIKDVTGDPKFSRLRIFEKYFRLNTRMLLIVDDCSDQINDISEICWKRLITKSRHFRITLILTVHNVQDLKIPCLRTQPFFNIFTHASVATYFIGNTTTGAKGVYTPDPKEMQMAFTNGSKPKRIIIDREKSTMSVFEFKWDVEPQPLGDAIIWKYQKYLDSKKKSKPEIFDRAYIEN
jgi:hypothetical protein